MIKNFFQFMTFSLLLTVTSPLGAQTFTTLHNFTNMDGQGPGAGLVLASNVLYGTTFQGGSQSNGTMFAVNTDGSNFRVLHSFTATDPVTGTNSDGAFPAAGLVLSGNTLFGTTAEGGTNSEFGIFGCGTIFSVNTDGTNFTVLHQFDGSDGFSPHARLLLSGGILYGTTYWGGKYADMAYGTMFSINTNGTGFNVMLDFYGYPEGENPEGDLTLVSNVFYGTTSAGGDTSEGTVFSFQTNYAFTPVLLNGGNPLSGLIFSGNTLYGTTSSGGNHNVGSIFSITTGGSNYVVLHNFTSPVPDLPTGTNADGATPVAGLMLCGNTLYGTTYYGGSQSNGVVFAVNTDGSGYTVLHNFTGTDSNNYTNADGANSESSIVMLNDTLYGTAVGGGSQGRGTVFSLQLPSIAGITRNLNGSLTINFTGGAVTNLVQVAASLSSPIVWQTISTNTAGANGLWQFTDTNANNYPYRFYRSSTP
jgi:uncharacterized repeat protein (TIGR03803 family)